MDEMERRTQQARRFYRRPGVFAGMRSVRVRHACGVHSIKVEFYSKKGKVRFLSHPLGDLKVTYALHL